MPLPVPATSIYSPVDGIVAWATCLDDPAPHAETSLCWPATSASVTTRGDLCGRRSLGPARRPAAVVAGRDAARSPSAGANWHDGAVNVAPLVSVVLGAVLALVGGVATELWKQRKAARAAARLVWLELILARSALFGAVALGRWRDDFPFSDDAWTAQRDRLALGWDTKAFRDVQAAYLQLQAIAATPPAERGDTGLFWPALVTIDRAAEAVGKAARVEQRELDQFRRPLAERLEETRTFVEQVRAAGPERMSDLLDEAAFRQNAAGILFHGKELLAWIGPRSKELDQFPPELLARAAEAIAHEQHTEPTPPTKRPPRR